MQVSFFNEHKVRNHKLGMAMDKIRNKYGSTVIVRAVSFTEVSTAIGRTKFVSGRK